MKPVTLSKRLQAVAAMVTHGNRVCDVGCDHGFVSIYLVEQGISPRVLAMDVRSGPLGAASAHVAERGLEAHVETRLSDGLHNYEPGEADALICAGMGGALMLRILSEDRIKTDSFRQLILQPQSEVEHFRAWLRQQGYRITAEDMIEEDGKYYPIMRVDRKAEAPSGEACQRTAYTGWRQGIISNTRNDIDKDVLCKLENRYGAILLRSGNAVLRAYLHREIRIYEEILAGLLAQGLSDRKRKDRYTEILELLGECRAALEIATSSAND